MSPPLVRHGWEIAFQPQLFALQLAELKAEVKRLRQELDPQSFVEHPQVTLLAAMPAALPSVDRCYAVFSSMVQRGDLLENWESLQRELHAG